MRILIAEDQKDLNKILTKKLTAEGYNVDSCFDGQEALDYLRAADYDGVILDVNMPRLDGFGVVKAMRASGSQAPVLFLTARDSIEDKVTGLDLGASDYLVKPFSFEELMARVRALTRRSAPTLAPFYTLCDLTLDPNSHRYPRGTRDQALRQGVRLLEYLLRNQGRVLSRENIENNLWNFDYEGGSNAVDVYIRYLRRKIDEAFSPKLIHTVRGVGYVLKEETPQKGSNTRRSAKTRPFSFLAMLRFLLFETREAADCHRLPLVF